MFAAHSSHTHQHRTLQIAFAATKQQFVRVSDIWLILTCNSELLILLAYNYNNLNGFLTLAFARLRLPEYDADALEHVAVLTKYFIRIYIYIYIYIYSCGKTN